MPPTYTTWTCLTRIHRRCPSTPLSAPKLCQQPRLKYVSSYQSRLIHPSDALSVEIRRASESHPIVGACRRCVFHYDVSCTLKPTSRTPTSLRTTSLRVLFWFYPTFFPSLHLLDFALTYVVSRTLWSSRPGRRRQFLLSSLISLADIQNGAENVRSAVLAYLIHARPGDRRELQPVSKLR
ncbi:hypothetical protein BDN70DRAFT_268426 [Pholiota conissans]|uniref:Uncharacterized protein n=1 Tax=Pholiota conissans TaxID=109636 RepID=A0A9P5YU85_9AGAR|nr:hypothetical protein BDN70DRAFT_268426 [Pholiota conissans]